MERRKLRAWAVLLVFVCSWLSACGNTDETTVPTTAAPTTARETQAPTPTVYVDPDELTELDVAVPTDAEDGVMTIYSWTNTFTNLLDEYTDVDYEIETIDINTYWTRLDMALASGENAPDLFVCGGNDAARYIHSDNTMPINNLGIDYDELADMYEYTLMFAADDDNVVKALTWEACPGAVIYNRDVAANVLGVSEPEDVAPYFADWASFNETAALVYEESEGSVYVVSGTDDLWRAYTASRTTSWVEGSSLNIDPVMTDFLDFALGFDDNDYVAGTTQLNSDWFKNMSNDSVLSYWGPMWLLNMIKVQDSYGHWGVVRGPADFSWGENWLMASSSCDMPASAGQIMKDLCLNAANSEDMASDGMFVNRRSIMEDIAESDDYTLSFLNDQNPYGIFDEVARGIDATDITANEQAFNDEFLNVVALYIDGELSSADEAEEEFESRVTELELV